MNVPQEELDLLAVLALRVKNTIYDAMIARPTDRPALLEEASHLAANLQTRLDRVGAEKPEGVPAARAETPLALLDTPANRRYMAALRDAWQAGMDMDRERYGDDIGTNGAAQVIEMVLRDVETEIQGPKGVGE